MPIFQKFLGSLYFTSFIFSMLSLLETLELFSWIIYTYNNIYLQVSMHGLRSFQMLSTSNNKMYM